MNNIKGIILKSFSDTRWEGIKVMKPLRHQIEQVYDILFSVYKNTDIIIYNNLSCAILYVTYEP